MKPSRRRSLFLIALPLTLLMLSGALAQTPQPKVLLPDAKPSVYQGANKKLVYVRDADGNQIPDFSNVGYRGGDTPLPTNIPVRVTVAPVTGDAGAAIQAAIDTVSKLPIGKDGFRGALLLKHGRYRVAGSVYVRASGVVLRGEGEGIDGTVIIATGAKQRSLIIAGGDTAKAESEDASDDTPAPKSATALRETTPRYPLTDNIVPLGAHSFHVANAAKLFHQGDTVLVRRPSIAEWIHTIGMDRIPMAASGNTIQWTAGSKDLVFDRVVTGVSGDTVSVDAPLCSPLEKRYGGGNICKYTFPGRIVNVGIENLRGDSEYKNPTDEDHGWKFVSLGAVQNSYVRHITAEHFGYSCVSVERSAKWVTVQECTNLAPISQITGGRRYSFNLAGQLTLFERCHGDEGRHDFVQSSTVAGPNVFVDCTGGNAHADTGPHHRWSVGCLYDNIHITGDKGAAINMQNRGNWGTGHGWAGAYQVFWNCTAPSMDIQSPPTAKNWAIGCQTSKRKGNGEWESFGIPMTPRSLYYAQLAERRR